MKVVLDEGAKLPVKAHNTDAGWDLFAKEDFTIPATVLKKKKWWKLLDREIVIGTAIHDTGVHIEIPENYKGNLEPKSGLNVKKSILSFGTIDCGYTGSIVVKLYNLSSRPYSFKKGDKITQLTIMPISKDNNLEIVDSLSETERGDGGFGSTGK